MLINYAHRGASGYYPENTILAFEKAIEMGATGIETDIQMTKDGVLVLIHDEKVDRTTDGVGLVKDYTYEELCTLNAGTSFSSIYKGLKIPTLQELIEFSKDKNILLDLELKNNEVQYPNIEEKLVEMIQFYNIEDIVVVSSFNHYSLVKIKKLSKRIKIGLLYMAGLYHPEEYAKALNAEALHPYFPDVNDSKIIKDIKKSKILINPFTINDEAIMKEFINYGVDGIITNYPDKLAALLNNANRNVEKI